MSLESSLNKFAGNRPIAIGAREKRDLHALFSEMSVPCKRKPNQTLVDLVEDTRHVCLLVSGWAFSFRMFDNGQRQIVNIHLPGDVIGLSSLVDASDEGGCLALTDASFLLSTRDQLMRRANCRPDIAFCLISEALRSEILLREQLSDVARRPATQRIANFLFELFCRSRGSLALADRIAARTSIPLTQDQIADAIGLTPIHVSRTLKKFKSMGVIEYVGHDLRIVDSNLLHGMTTFSSAYIQWLQNPAITFRPTPPSSLPARHQQQPKHAKP